MTATYDMKTLNRADLSLVLSDLIDEVNVEQAHIDTLEAMITRCHDRIVQLRKEMDQAQAMLASRWEEPLVEYHAPPRPSNR